MLQVRVADSNKSSHGGGEDTRLEIENDKSRKKKIIKEIGNEQEHTKRRIPFACPSQLSAFSLSNFWPLAIYIEKMAPEESLYVGFSGARVTLHVHWDECCRKVVMVPAKTSSNRRRLGVYRYTISGS